MWSGVWIILVLAVLVVTTSALAGRAGWLPGPLTWLGESGLWGRLGLSAIFGEPAPGAPGAPDDGRLDSAADDDDPLPVAVQKTLAEIDAFLADLDRTLGGFDDIADSDLELAGGDPTNPLRTGRLIREIRENRNIVPKLAGEVGEAADRLAQHVNSLRLGGSSGTGGTSGWNQRRLDDTFYRARLSRWQLRDTLGDVEAEVVQMREEIRVQNWQGAIQRLETVAAIQSARIEELGYLHQYLVALDTMLPYSRQNRSSSVDLP